MSEETKEPTISDHTYYRWRREYGRIRTEQAKRLKMLGKENDRLKKVVPGVPVEAGFITPLS